MANDSDSENEREMSYREPTMVERIGPEEARRLLMDDDDDEQIASRRVDDGNFSHIRPHLIQWRVIFFKKGDIYGCLKGTMAKNTCTFTPLKSLHI